jgi:mitochondrial import inner membrane translocase subunit TIM50
MSYLRRAVASWRTFEQVAGSTAKRSFSESTTGGGSKATSSSTKPSLSDPAAHPLFDNITIPPEAAAAKTIEGSSAAAAGIEGTAGPLLENTAVGRAFSALGNALFFASVGAASFFGYYTYRYSTDEVDSIVKESKQGLTNSNPATNVWTSVMDWYVEKRRTLESEMKKYADPPSDKLLPDLPPHVRHVKTLVLDLDGILVHSDWSRGRGWRTFKRPGADDFIRDLAQYFELVVYTSQLPTYADPILDRLDPHRMIQYRLYRDSTQYVDGRHVRDLSKLNRDLKQVLLITSDPEAYALQPDNAIKLPSWKMEEEVADTTLLDLLPFLEAIVRTNVRDVRDVVKSYEGQHIPTAFKERMKTVAERQEAKKQHQRGFLGKR